MEQYEYFKSEITFSQDTYKELKMYILSSKMKRLFIFFAMSGLFAIIMGLYRREYAVALVGAMICLPYAVAYVKQPKELMKHLMDRNIETIGSIELPQLVSFFDDKIKIYGAKTGSTIYLAYDVIERYAETKSTYSLFTKTNLIVVVNKLALIQEQRDGEFIKFLRYKCRNIKLESKYF